MTTMCTSYARRSFLRSAALRTDAGSPPGHTPARAERIVTVILGMTYLPSSGVLGITDLASRSQYQSAKSIRRKPPCLTLQRQDTNANTQVIRQPRKPGYAALAEAGPAAL